MVNLLQQLNEEMAAVSQGVQRSLVQITNGSGAGAGTIWPGCGEEPFEPFHLCRDEGGSVKFRAVGIEPQFAGTLDHGRIFVCEPVIAPGRSGCRRSPSRKPSTGRFG